MNHSLPFFYLSAYDSTLRQIILDESTSRHIVQVLRMKPGEQLQLTDGKGTLLTAQIADNHQKHCTIEIMSANFQQPGTKNITVAMSLLKNTSRFEWFLEKATEIGIREFIPLLCSRTEKQKFRTDRMQSILVSAMLQSQQCWLPQLTEIIFVEKLIRQADYQQKFIAHCTAAEKASLADAVNSTASSFIIFIGPEGDFTNEEIKLALDYQFIPVTLGKTRLRSETAGIVAATILSIIR